MARQCLHPAVTFVLTQPRPRQRVRRSPGARSWRLATGVAIALSTGCHFEVSASFAPPEPAPGAGELDQLASDAGSLPGPSGGDAALPAKADAPFDRPRVQHGACSVPPPDELPPPPVVASDAVGRPAFDRWRDFDCATLEPLARCQRDMVDLSLVGCGECVFPDAEDPGFCMGERAVEGGALAPLFFRGTDCAVEVTDEVRARACCEAPDRFDCRSWPYPEDSQIGQACSVHHDCEPGLACKQVRTGLGACSCPEQAPSQPRSPADCSDFIVVF